MAPGVFQGSGSSAEILDIEDRLKTSLVTVCNDRENKSNRIPYIKRRKHCFYNF